MIFEFWQILVICIIPVMLVFFEYHWFTWEMKDTKQKIDAQQKQIELLIKHIANQEKKKK